METLRWSDSWISACFLHIFLIFFPLWHGCSIRNSSRSSTCCCCSSSNKGSNSVVILRELVSWLFKVKSTFKIDSVRSSYVCKGTCTTSTSDTSHGIRYDRSSTGNISVHCIIWQSDKKSQRNRLLKVIKKTRLIIWSCFCLEFKFRFILRLSVSWPFVK